MQTGLALLQSTFPLYQLEPLYSGNDLRLLKEYEEEFSGTLKYQGEAFLDIEIDRNAGWRVWVSPTDLFTSPLTKRQGVDLPSTFKLAVIAFVRESKLPLKEKRYILRSLS